MTKVRKYDYLIVGLVAFTYYLILSSKSWTWIFASQDSGDWLYGSLIWANVQPLGSPLYVLLGHFMNWIFPQHLVLAMTIGLSVLPASICVSVVYLTAKKLTSFKYAVISALVLLGSAVFLSQSTILEEYAISAMFVSLAFYFYISDRKKLTVLMLALGSAVHVIVAMVSVIWLIVNVRDLKLWVKYLWIYLVFGILPYSMVFILMYLDTPRLLAGHLSFEGINNYLGSSGTIGSLSLWDTPERLLQFAMVVAVSLGFAILPLVYSFKGLIRSPKYVLVAFSTIMFTLWLYLTNSDQSTWTFLTFSMPIIAVLVGVGLSKLGQFHAQTVTCGAIVLILVNGLFLNANVLTNQMPLATNYEQSISSLPDDSYIICSSGGQYGLANAYLWAKGHKITPLFYSADTPSLESMVDLVMSQNKQIKFEDALKLATTKYNDALNLARHVDYMKYFGIVEKETTKEVERLLSIGKRVYIVNPTITPYWENVFRLETYDENLSIVVGVNE